jgi:prepilin peptidase CpaA
MVSFSTPAQTWLEPHGLLPSALMLAGVGALIYAALHDIAARTVPNQVPGGLFAFGIALRLLGHSLLPGLAWAGGIFVLAAVCWWRGWLGGGDVKLLPACALMLPPALCAEFLAAVSLAGGMLALFYLVLAAIARRGARPERVRSVPRPNLWRRAVTAERWRLLRGVPLPYATAIAAGFLFTLFRV